MCVSPTDCMHIFELTHKVTSVEMLKRLRKTYEHCNKQKQKKKNLGGVFIVQ